MNSNKLDSKSRSLVKMNGVMYFVIVEEVIKENLLKTRVLENNYEITFYGSDLIIWTDSPERWLKKSDGKCE